MKKVFYLKTCDTCSKILAQMNLEGFERREIKSQAISEKEVEEMHKISGSYESLFSRKSLKYRAMGLHEKTLTEADYKRLITEEYTFLKRPVFIFDNQIFVGNTKNVVEEVKKLIGK
jgi:arsenate reductase-like glutaredoxin family protein